MTEFNKALPPGTIAEWLSRPDTEELNAPFDALEDAAMRLEDAAMFLRRSRRSGPMAGQDLKRAFLNAECGYKAVAKSLNQSQRR